MANITLLGVNYADVPAIDLPKTGGGTVRFSIPDLVQKTITLNGTYAAEDEQGAPDGYDEVTVNVQNGATMTEVANTYGTGVIISSAQGVTPSATRHTIYFEFEDETDLTVYAYYDNAFISSAITATTPTTYDNKTVTLAQLDGVTWYSYTPPAPGSWVTIYDGGIVSYDGAATIPELSDVEFAEGETYRVTLDGVEYVRSTVYFNGAQSMWVVGNPDLITDEQAQGGDPFCVFNAGWGALYILCDSGDHTFKFEKQDTA